MSSGATAGLTLAGIALVALAVRDIFETLLHPEGRGPLARAVMGAVWRLCHRPRGGRRVLQLAGPLGLLLVVGVWATFLVLAWALLLWPQLESGFRLEEPAQAGFWDAMHLSLTTLTTLGSPEFLPEKAWLRVITPLEALIGFGLLSASISYLLLIYPALARRRSLAYEVHLLRKTDPQREGDGVPADEGVYSTLTSRVVAIERDLVALPVTYYFTESDERFSMAAAAPYLLEIARRGTRVEHDEGVRRRARLLLDALNDLAETTAALFPRTRSESTDDVFAAYARDHLVAGPSERPA